MVVAGVLNIGRDRVMNVAIDEETIYIQSQNGFISAFDSETGDRRWAQLVGRLDNPQLPLTSNDDTVLVTSGIKLFGIDKWEGGSLWEIALAEQAGARPVSDDERVYIASQEGSVMPTTFPEFMNCTTITSFPNGQSKPRFGGTALPNP